MVRVIRRLVGPMALLGLLLGSVPVARAQTAAPACVAPLTLTLAAIPADDPTTPPGTVEVQVPLYPGATPTDVPMALPTSDLFSSHFVKVAQAEYLVPTDWTTAQSWYQAAFAACGFHPDGLFGPGDVSGTGVISEGFGVRDANGVHIDLTFEKGPNGGALLLYDAYAITPPPPITLVPGNPSAITIAAWRPTYGQVELLRSVTVRDPAAIAALQQQLNSLPRFDTPSLAPGDGSHDTLQISYPDGHVLDGDVSVGAPYSVYVGSQAAVVTQSLLDLLASLLRCPGAVRFGWPYDACRLAVLSRQALTHDGASRFLGWSQDGSQYLYLDRGTLWAGDVTTGNLRVLPDNEVSSKPVNFAVFDDLADARDILFRPRLESGYGPLVAVDAKNLKKRHTIGWAPRTAVVGTQAGSEASPWSNTLNPSFPHIWFRRRNRLVGIDPGNRNDVVDLPFRLPRRSLVTVSGDGLSAAVATDHRLMLRSTRTGKLIRRLTFAHSVKALSWSTDNRTLAYVEGGRLHDVDVRTGQRHALASAAGHVGGMTWDPYGHVLAASVGGRLLFVNADGSGLGTLEWNATTPNWNPTAPLLGYTRRHGKGHDAWLDSLSPLAS